MDRRNARGIASACVVLVLTVSPSVATTQDSPNGFGAMNREKWGQDLTALTGLLTRLHADAFHAASREELNAEVARLRSAIPQMDHHEIIVAMARLVVSIGDGHTRLNIGQGSPGVPRDPAEGFVALPLRLQWFAEGLFVRSAAEDWAHLVGSRVVEIGRVPVADAIRHIRRIVHHDNEMTVRSLLPRYATVPAVLHATGVIDSVGPVRMVVESADGDRTEVNMRASPNADAGAVDVATAPGIDIPWWLLSRGRPYWMEAVPGSEAIYVQVNASRSHPDEPMEDFVQRVRGVLDGEEVTRVILDLRRNDGGDNRLTRPLVAVLTGWQAASRDHGLYVLIGRATFSAAVVLAAELERYARPVFVGEPTGGAPNQFGEIERFALTNSGLTVSYASWYFQTSDPWDVRPWVAPDVFVDSHFRDFSTGRDASLDTALSHDFRTPSLASQLRQVARDQTVDAAMALYSRYRAQPQHRYAATEQALTELVYDLWRRDEVAASLPVALLVTEEYPRSFEALENVAEIYAELENRREAARYAIASLRLHPANGDAVEVLRAVCGDDVTMTYLGSEASTDAGQAALLRACGIEAGL